MANLSELIQYTASPRYSDTQLISTDRSILSSRQVEIIPREASTFGYQSANNVAYNGTLSRTMTFNVSDPRHYLDLANSYFHADVKINSSLAAGVPMNSFLDNGGIHALIKSVIVRHGSAEIHRVENYNKLYNAMTLPVMGKEYRDRVLGDCADSYEDKYEQVGSMAYATELTADLGEAKYTAAGQILSFADVDVDSDVYNELEVGDLIRIETAVLNYTGRVLTITAKNTVTIEGLPAADIAPAAILSLKVLRPAQKKSQRLRIVQHGANAADCTETHKVVWQLPLGFFSMEQYFPLPFLNQNMEITFEFVEPWLGLVVPAGQGALTNLQGYAITKPRFVAHLMEPSADVFEAHRRLWKEDGLIYKMQNYRNFENQLTSGTQFNLSYQTNLKSVNHILSVMTDQAAANSGVNAVATQEAYSQSDFNKNDLNSFRFRVGGMAFPDYGSVNCDSIGNSEAWKQLQLVLGNIGNIGSDSSIPAWKWREVNSDKFIMAMQMAKEHGVYNNGIDASSNYIEHEIVLGTDVQALAQTLHTFIAFDQVLALSEKDGARLYY